MRGPAARLAAFLARLCRDAEAAAALRWATVLAVRFFSAPEMSRPARLVLAVRFASAPETSLPFMVVVFFGVVFALSARFSASVGSFGTTGITPRLPRLRSALRALVRGCAVQSSFCPIRQTIQGLR